MTALGVLFVAAKLALVPLGMSDNPFADARIAPADANLFVHVEGAALIRQELADRPIAAWLNGMAQNSMASKAWAGLAQAAQIDQSKLFDVCFGERCTLVMRERGEWAVITAAEESKVLNILRSLKIRVREPRAGMAVADLPEQELLLARGAGMMVIGPVKHANLFYEILPRIDAPATIANSLAAQPCMAKAAALGAGRIAVFIRQDPPLGGFSAAVAELTGDQLTIHHAAQFDHAPFSHGVTTLTCDFSPVLRFKNSFLMAFLQPADIGDGPMETFLSASLGEGLISTSMRRNLGDRRLIVVGEAEGRQLDKPVDLLSTTFVTCLQVKNRESAIRELDEQMARITQRLNGLGKGSFLVQMPQARVLKSTEPREVELAGASEWFTGGFPIMKNVNLCWTVADGPQGSWYVIGSHRQSLDEVAAALKQPSDSPALVGRFENIGVGNGVRIARHLRSWSDLAPQFAEPDKVDDFRSALRSMSDLAGGMQECQWKLARPSLNEMRLDLQIKLTPPESSRNE